VTRLLLVRHAATSATESSSFGADEPIVEGAAAQALTLAASFPKAAEVRCSPALRCRQTAAAAALDPVIDPRIAECDFGRWEGRSLAQIHADEPEAAASWMRDPEAAPHGGESLTRFSERVSRWLDLEAVGRDGDLIAITHAGVIAAVVAHVLQAPLAALWRVRAAPLTVTEIEAVDGHFTVRRLGAAA
jgi:broad specificity phosphatase PhoE